MQKRNRGTQDSIGRLLEPEQLVPYPHLEDQHQHPVGCPDREQVHHDGRDGDHEGAEHHHQQDERQAQHEGEHGRRQRADEMDGVAVEGRLAGDVHGGVEIGEGGRDEVAAQLAHRFEAALGVGARRQAGR